MDQKDQTVSEKITTIVVMLMTVFLGGLLSGTVLYWCWDIMKETFPILVKSGFININPTWWQWVVSSLFIRILFTLFRRQDDSK